MRYDTGDISDVGAAVWMYDILTMGLVTIGVHTVEVVLEKQNPKVASDIVLTDVELVIHCLPCHGYDNFHEVYELHSYLNLNRHGYLKSKLHNSIPGKK